jgi:hypothetical protein
VKAAAAVALTLVLAGCAPRAPRLVAPDSIESFCPGAPPRGSAIVGVLSSVADPIEPVDVPSDDAIRTHLRETSGAIGHWKTQPLYMSGTARALGVSGDYIDVSEVAIANDSRGGDSRIIFVTVATPQGPKRLALRAYEMRNVCSAASASPAS